MFLHKKLQELGPIETANIKDALNDVVNKKDFGGIEFKANFADSYFPYSFLDVNEGLSGILYDVLNIASKTLNVSLKYQDPQPHNFDIWSKRYINCVQRLLVAINLLFYLSIKAESQSNEWKYNYNLHWNAI